MKWPLVRRGCGFACTTVGNDQWEKSKPRKLKFGHSGAGPPCPIFNSVHAELSDEELADLSLLVVSINGWNRLRIAFRPVPGSADKIYGLEKAGLA